MAKKFGKLLYVFIFLSMFVAHAAFAAMLDINLQLTGFTPDQETIFNNAASYWEGLLAYQNGISVDPIPVAVEAKTMDGVGGQLGGGGFDSTDTFTNSGGQSYVMTTTGGMEYDSADLAVTSNDGLYQLALHELAHVLGIGTLWVENSVYTNGSFQYTGAAALAEYQKLVPGATYVPVENDGGEGSVDAHWEKDFFSPGGPDSLFGVNNELMTADQLADTVPWFVSDVTKYAYEDIGYQVVPLPGAVVLLASGLLGLIGIGRRKA
jgi:hypothetical protein